MGFNGVRKLRATNYYVQNECVTRMYDTVHQQSGAAEACWAHNPEVDGSKPSSANTFVTSPIHGLGECI